VFDAAARAGSFRAAADALGVTPTAISHQIATLEAQLGVALFERHARGVALTEAGARLATTTRDVFIRLDAAVDEIKARATVVTIAATPAFAALWLARRMAAFEAACPGHSLRVEADWVPVDLDRERNIDIAIRYGPEPRRTATTIPLLRERFGAYAAPSVIGALDRGERVPLIEVAWRSPSLPAIGWEAWGACAGIAADSLPTRRVFTDETMAIQAAIAGQGALLLSDVLAKDALAHGWLLPWRGDVSLDGFTYSALSTTSRLTARRTRRAWEWLQAVASESETSGQSA
jgi:DNA-binding transcriptional LysR family regulator